MKVLAVDDSAVARRLIRNELGHAGYEVLEAANGEDAMDMIQSEQPDLVTLDVHMPGMDGFETCRRIRALELMQDELEGSGVPVVFVTADDTVAGRIEGFRAGAADFLVKPFHPGAVRRAVDALLQDVPNRSGVRALVAEDSPLVRRIICTALGQLGVEPLPVGDGQDALALLRNDPAAAELVISDFIMPRMNGDALCRAIRNEPNLSHLPVLVLSALERTDDLRMIFRAGASDFLPKPFVKEVFLSRVAALMQGHEAADLLRERLLAIYGEEHYLHALRRFGHTAGSDVSEAARVEAQIAC